MVSRGKPFSLRVGKQKYSFREWGDPAGPPILALHGWLDNSMSFSGLAPLLTGYRILALDFPGHGKSSPRPPGYPYHFIDYVEDIRKIQKAFGWKKFTLIGHSMGAGVASLFAGTFVDSVRVLVCIEGFGPISGPDEDVAKGLEKSIRASEKLDETRESVFQNLKDLVKVRIRVGPMANHSAEAIMIGGTKKKKEGFKLLRDPRLTISSRIRMSEMQVRSFIQRITCPVLVIEGQDGLQIWRDAIRERLDFVQNLTHTFLPGKHHLHIDDPSPVAEYIQNYLNIQASQKAHH